MTDTEPTLLERLAYSAGGRDGVMACETCAEAAEEIERLRAAASVEPLVRQLGEQQATIAALKKSIDDSARARNAQHEKLEDLLFDLDALLKFADKTGLKQEQPDLLTGIRRKMKDIGWCFYCGTLPCEGSEADS